MVQSNAIRCRYLSFLITIEEVTIFFRQGAIFNKKMWSRWIRLFTMWWSQNTGNLSLYFTVKHGQKRLSSFKQSLIKIEMTKNSTGAKTLATSCIKNFLSTLCSSVNGLLSIIIYMLELNLQIFFEKKCYPIILVFLANPISTNSGRLKTFANYYKFRQKNKINDEINGYSRMILLF